MRMSYGIVLLCISTQACPPTIWRTPTKGLGDRSSISLTLPSHLLVSVFSFVTDTRTLSPFRAPLALSILTKTSSPSSTFTKIFLSLIICTMPMTSAISLLRFSFLLFLKILPLERLVLECPCPRSPPLRLLLSAIVNLNVDAKFAVIIYPLCTEKIVSLQSKSIFFDCNANVRIK